MQHRSPRPNASSAAASPSTRRCSCRGPVVPELEWILRSSFELGKEAVLLALSSLLPVELTVKSERAVSRSGDRRAFLDT